MQQASLPPIELPGKGTSPLLRPLDVTMPTKISDLIPPLEQRVPGLDSLRTGLIAIKVGMVSEWDEHGVLTPLSVLWFDDNQVKFATLSCLLNSLWTILDSPAFCTNIAILCLVLPLKCGKLYAMLCVALKTCNKI
jgi:hypothetical protein